jgi:hypothetical protein
MKTAVEILNDEISIHLNFDQRLYLKEAFLNDSTYFFSTLGSFIVVVF